MPTRAVVAATLAAVIGSTLAATQSVPPLDRLIQTNIVLQVPVPPCVAPHLVRRLSREVGVPAGVEFLPESCGTSTADGDP